MCFNDTAAAEIYSLSLHDALPIFEVQHHVDEVLQHARAGHLPVLGHVTPAHGRDAALLGHRDDGCGQDRKSTRLNSSHANISYAVFCLTKTSSSVFSLIRLTLLIS